MKAMKLETIVQQSGKPILSAILPIFTAALAYNAGCSAVTFMEGNPTPQNEGGNGGNGGSGTGGQGGNGGEAPQCTPHAKLDCFQGDAYWNNSCNQLEDLFQHCTAAQKCENGACVDKYNCPKNIDLVADCQEQGCQLYDAFKNDICLWDVITGIPSVMNEKLAVTGTNLLELKNKVNVPANCNNDFAVKYTVQTNTPDVPGSYMISLRDASPDSTGITFTHMYGQNNKIILQCNGFQETFGDFDLKNIKNIEVRKEGALFNLYLENKPSASLTCTNVTPFPINKVDLQLGSAVFSQNFTLDDVTFYCGQ